MGEDYSDTWSSNNKYYTTYGDFVIPNCRRYRNNDIFYLDLEDTYKKYSDKFDEILNNILSEFSGINLKITHYNTSTNIRVDIVVEDSIKRTYLDYNIMEHSINGLVCMSLGRHRDLVEITEGELGIIRKELLIWIYENI